jgi:hypothetical protein
LPFFAGFAAGLAAFGFAAGAFALAINSLLEEYAWVREEPHANIMHLKRKITLSRVQGILEAENGLIV